MSSEDEDERLNDINCEPEEILPIQINESYFPKSSDYQINSQPALVQRDTNFEFENLADSFENSDMLSTENVTIDNSSTYLDTENSSSLDQSSSNYNEDSITIKEIDKKVQIKLTPLNIHKKSTKRREVTRKVSKNEPKRRKLPTVSNNSLSPPDLCLICNNAQISRKLSLLFLKQQNFKWNEMNFSKITNSLMSSLLDAPADFEKFFTSISSFPFCGECLVEVIGKIYKIKEKITKLEAELGKEISDLRKKVRKSLGNRQAEKILKDFWQGDKENLVNATNLREEFRKRVIIDDNSNKLLVYKISSLPQTSTKVVTIAKKPVFIRHNIPSSQMPQNTKSADSSLNSTKKSTNIQFVPIIKSEPIDKITVSEFQIEPIEIPTSPKERSCKIEAKKSLIENIKKIEAESGDENFDKFGSGNESFEAYSSTDSEAEFSRPSAKKKKKSSTKFVRITPDSLNLAEGNSKKGTKKFAKKSKSVKFEKYSVAHNARLPILKYPNAWGSFPPDCFNVTVDGQIVFENYEIKCNEDDPEDLYFICVTCDEKIYLKDLKKTKRRRRRVPFRHMMEHIKAFHKEFYKCHECDLVMKSLERYNFHMKSSVKHNISNPQLVHVICEVCGKTCTKTKLINHIWTHKSQEEKDECIKNGETEPKTFSRPKYKDLNFKCKKCRKGFVLEKNYKDHLENSSCRLDEKFLCPQCGKSFETRNGLTSHYRRAHEPDKLPVKSYCHICFKRFSSECTYKIHLMTHTGEKPFPCTLCTKSFRRKAHLKSHLESCSKRNTNNSTNEDSYQEEREYNNTTTSTTNANNSNRESNRHFMSELIPQSLYDQQRLYY